MAEARGFIHPLIRAGKSAKEVNELRKEVLGTRAISTSQVYKLVKKHKNGESFEDTRGQHGTKTVRTDDMIATVEAIVEEDRRVTYQEIEEETGLSHGTVFTILHVDLGLSKKAARWVPKLLSPAQKEERVRCAVEFRKELFKGGRAFLESIITMDETLVSFATPEKKNQSKQWLPRGSPAPTKCKVQASRKKQMVLSFFDIQGLVYQNYVPLGTTVNSAYFIGALRSFLKALRMRRPQLVERGWFFHMDNAPCHTSATTKEFLVTKYIRTISHPPYSPNLAPADFFFFPKMKSALAGVKIEGNNVKTEWERVCNTITKDDFMDAFNKWVDRWAQCEEREGGYVEK